MFSFARLIKEQTQKSAASAADEGVARVAISEEGQIIYASETFRRMAEMPVFPAAPMQAATLLQFTEPGKTLFSLTSGIHAVRIAGQGKALNFHFDWLTTPDRRRYLVASQEGAGSFAEIKTIEREILKTGAENKAPAAKLPAPLGREDFRNFSALSHDIMLAADGTGNILRVSDSFGRLLGYQPEDIQTMDFIDLFHDADKPYIRGAVQTLSLEASENPDAGPMDFEARVLTRAGEELWMEWRCSQGDDGTLYCIGHDVTAIRIQKQALEKREKQLLEAESIGRMGHWHWTIGEEKFEWSNELYRIFGVSPRDFTPTLQTMNKMVHRGDIARVNQAFQRAVIEQNDYDMEFRILQPGGDIRFIRCEGRCATDANGEVIALFGIMQDMTERILYERELKEAKNAAERAYAAKSQFLANMSHELRTPLNAIIGFSEMMHRQLLGPIGTPQYLEYIQGIRESGEHLLDLINDILDMSKIEAGKYELALEEVRVAKSIKLAMHMMEGRAMEAEIALSFSGLLNEDLIIVADRRAFLQILLNLLSNAIKFTREGGKVSVECAERQDYIAVKVSDNGIGIPANKLAAITKPFEQVSTDYAREHQGSGLGLAITKELTEMHGGALFIESTVGAGTTVTVRLPYDASKAGKTGR